MGQIDQDIIPVVNRSSIRKYSAVLRIFNINMVPMAAIDYVSCCTGFLIVGIPLFIVLTSFIRVIEVEKSEASSSDLPVAVALLCGPAHAADESAELASLLNEFLAGASVNDAAVHERFWADDLVYTSSGGERFGKQAILDGLKTENAETAEPAVVYSAEDVRIRLYDDIAVVAFRLLGTALGEPAEVTQYLNTGTFQKREGEWKAVAWQATRVPQAD